MLNKPTWSLSNNRFNPILVGQEIERLDTVEKNREIGNHWHLVASVFLVATVYLFRIEQRLKSFVYMFILWLWLR